MFSRAVIACPQAEQCEPGTTRLNAFASGSFSPRISAHCACQSRSIIFGRRWTTTFRNDPAMRPNTSHSQGKTAGCVNGSRKTINEEEQAARNGGEAHVHRFGNRSFPALDFLG